MRPRGEFRWDWDAFCLRDSTPCRSKGTILRYPYLVTDRKIFLEALLAPIYTTFEGGASDFSVFLAFLAYFCLFLKNLLAAQNILSKWSRHSDFE